MKATHAPQRNQLVWLNPEGWQGVLARPWDAQALTILLHWKAAQLPLVVTTRRAPQETERISLGLPAPTVWGRRKLALDVLPSGLHRVGDFPVLEQIAASHGGAPAIARLLACMQSLQVPLHVYGSFGWQALTGMEYVRPSSDLDLRACVPNHHTAQEVARVLNAMQLPLRIDGELAFPHGVAIAWREYLQWMHGGVQQVLVKSRQGVQLAAPDRVEPCAA